MLEAASVPRPTEVPPAGFDSISPYITRFVASELGQPNMVINPPEISGLMTIFVGSKPEEPKDGR